jgi:hypothetical protein
MRVCISHLREPRQLNQESAVLVEIFMLEGSPFPHGISVCKGYIDWADDIGGGITPVWRVKI